jgi:acyl-CoA thioesterase FadM
MLGYSLRLVRSGLLSAIRPRIGYFDESVAPMRVWPADVDTWGHMNNGRYLTVMDLGRTDWAVRTGVLRVWVRESWSPILGGATIRYKRTLRPLRSYELRTRMLCWDDKWFYFEQRFTRHDRLYAVALAKGMIRHGGAPVPPSEMATALGVSPESPPIPEAVARWAQTESSLLDQ